MITSDFTHIVEWAKNPSLGTEYLRGIYRINYDRNGDFTILNSKTTIKFKKVSDKAMGIYELIGTKS